MKFIYLLIITLCIALVGCRSTQPVQVLQNKTKQTIKTDVKEVLRDTVILFESDTAIVQALIECDEAGRAMIKQLKHYESGKHIKPPIVSIDKNNVLTATAVIDSFSIYLTYKERYETINTNESTIIEKPIITNILSGWQWFQIWFGRIVLVLALLLLGFRLLLPKLLKILQ